MDFTSNKNIYIADELEHDIEPLSEICIYSPGSYQHYFDDVLEWCCDNFKGSWSYYYVDNKTLMLPNQNPAKQNYNKNNITQEEKISVYAHGQFVRYLKIAVTEMDDIVKLKLVWG